MLTYSFRRRGEIIKLIEVLAVISIVVMVGGVILQAEVDNITELCTESPNGYFPGEATLNCTEWNERRYELNDLS